MGKFQEFEIEVQTEGQDLKREIGLEMSGGPGTASARFAMNVLEYYLKH